MSSEEKLQRNQFVHELSLEYAKRMLDEYISVHPEEINGKNSYETGLLKRMEDYYSDASTRFSLMFFEKEQKTK